MTKITTADRSPPIIIFLRAQSFMKAADQLNSLNPLDYNAPVAFLYVHSAELFLKCYLKLKLPNTELKKIGHNLKKLKEETIELFVNANPDYACILNRVAKHKVNNDSRYPEFGYKGDYPSSLELKFLCDYLHATIKNKMKEYGHNIG